MHYITEGTTKRYKGNSLCEYGDFAPTHGDLCQYGCEFEFYIDTDKHSYTNAIEKITEELYSLTPKDILVDVISLPASADKNVCMQVKPDISLQDNGIEISIPISTKEGVVHFINKIMALIAQYGYTNEETGFHIHISTIENNGKHLDFYRFMLLCDDAKILSSWKPRPGYSQNVMDILSSHSKKESRVIKTKKGTIWNLERIDTHHIEIKSIGGEDYHKNPTQITEEFEIYTKLFIEAIGEMNAQQKKLLLLHKQKIDGLTKEIKVEFVTALGEAGIFP